MSKKTDKQLIHRFLKGDQEALGEVVERYQRHLYFLCLRLSGNHEDALELVQQTFVRILENLDHFQGRSSFKTWMYRIAVNLCRNFIKQQSLRAQILTQLPATTDFSWDSLEEKERREVVQTSLQILPEKQKVVVILRIYHNLSYQEISQILGCQEVTVRSHFHLALKKLAKELKNLVEISEI